MQILQTVVLMTKAKICEAHTISDLMKCKMSIMIIMIRLSRNRMARVKHIMFCYRQQRTKIKVIVT